MRRELHARPLRGEWHVVAIGKAAGAMTLGALDSLGARVVGGLVVTKPGHVPSALDSHGALRILESAHPQPDERSLAAGLPAMIHCLVDPEALTPTMTLAAIRAKALAAREG